MAGKNIYLIGFMGAGKTTVGKELAKKTGYVFIDLDEYIVEKTGETIPAIFEKHGEEEFRRLEKVSLAELTESGCIIATGGGIVESKESVSMMKEKGFTVYLESPFTTLYERIKEDTNRPLTAQGAAALSARFNRRLPLYEQAEYTIHTEKLGVDEIVEMICRRYEG